MIQLFFYTTQRSALNDYQDISKLYDTISRYSKYCILLAIKNLLSKEKRLSRQIQRGRAHRMTRRDVEGGKILPTGGGGKAKSNLIHTISSRVAGALVVHAIVSGQQVHRFGVLAGARKIYCTFGTRSAATVILVQHLSRGNIAAEIFIESDPNISSLNDPAYKSNPVVYKPCQLFDLVSQTVE